MRFKFVGFLHQSSLSLATYGKKHKVEEVRLDFPVTVVLNGDIIDLEKFTFGLKNELIKRADLKGSEILLLIPEEKVFTKKFQLKTSTKEEEKTLLFTQIPFTQEEVTLNIFRFGDKTQFVAVPKNQIQNLEIGFAKLESKVSFLPFNQLLALGLGKKNKQLIGYRLDDHFNLLVVHNDFVEYSREINLNREKEIDVLWAIQNLNTVGIDKIEGITLINKEEPLGSYFAQNGIKVNLNKLGDDLYPTLLKIVSSSQNKISKYFLGSDQNQSKKQLNLSLKKISLFLGVGLVVILLVIFYTFFGKQKLSTTVTNIKNLPLASVSAQPIMSSTPTDIAKPTSSVTIEKANLKLKLLNGNGIAGDASKIEKKLNEMGYINSEIGTYPQGKQNDTELKVNNRVVIEYKNEIQELLESLYLQVKVGEEEGSDFDIEIILGSKKK